MLNLIFSDYLQTVGELKNNYIPICRILVECAIIFFGGWDSSFIYVQALELLERVGEHGLGLV